MADGRHFVNRYISLSQPRIVRLWQNMVCERKFWPWRRKCEKIPEIPKFKMADDRQLKIIFGYNSAPYCPIKTIFGVRRLNCPHTNFDKGDGNVIKKSEIPKFKMADGPRIENQFLAITQLHVVPLRWNLECGGRITRIRSRSGELRKFNIADVNIVKMATSAWAANRPNLTKYGTQTLILTQPSKHDKDKSDSI